MDIQAIQQGLADAASQVDGLTGFATLPESINPPIFAATEIDITYNRTFGAAAMTEILVTCGIFTSRGDSEYGRSALAAYVAPTGAASVKAALELDRTLHGACKTLIVEHVRGMYRLYTVGGVDYLGAFVDVRVWG